MSLRLTTITTLDELSDLADEWDSFIGQSDSPTIFQSWLWNSTWCREVLSRDATARLAVKVLQYPSGQVAAILPFYDRLLTGSAIRISQFLSHRMCSYNDILLADPTCAELTDEVVCFLSERYLGAGFLHVRQLVHESGFLKSLLKYGYAEPQCQRVWVEFDGDPAFEPLQRVSKSRRKQIRRGEKRLKQLGPMTIKVSRGEEISESFDSFVSLHFHRQTRKGVNSVLDDNNTAFLKAALCALGRMGAAEIMELRSGDKTIAALVQVKDRDRYYSLQSGFDTEYADCSPVWILDAAAMRRAFHELDCARYELGAVYNSYKYSWNPQTGTNYFANIGGRGMVGRMLARTYGYLFRSTLPKVKALFLSIDIPLAEHSMIVLIA